MQFKFWGIAFIAVGLCCFASFSYAQDLYTIQSPGRETLAKVPKAWRDVVESKGTQLDTSVNGLATPVAAVWFAKSVAGSEQKTSDPGINYPQLKQGAVVGLLFFPADTPEELREDSFDQKLAPGFYTLRYAQLTMKPAEGKSSPFRDFVVLTPLDSDVYPEQVRPMAELLKASRALSHNGEPVAVSLVPHNPAYKELPAAIGDDAGQCALQVTIHVLTQKSKTPRDIPLAIVLLTPKGEDDAS